MQEEKTYELTYLASSRLDEKSVKEARSDIDSSINEVGEIIKSEEPKEIALAYPIKKEKDAFLGVTMFRAQKDKVLSVKHKLDKDSRILRFLLIFKENPGMAHTRAVPTRKISRKAEREQEIEKPKKRKKVDLEQIETELEGIAKGKL